MRISMAEKALDILIKDNNIQKGVPFLRSAPGVGKSSIVKALVKKLSETTGTPYEFVDLRLSQHEAVDIKGIPRPDMDKKVTKWFAPEFMPFKGIYPESKGILFLDEANRANQSVLQAIFQLVYDRKVGDFEIQDGWSIILAGNLGYEDDTDVVEFDSALNDRLISIDIQVNLEDWLNWARENNLNKYVIGFIEKNPSYLEKKFENNDDDKNFRKRLTPRTWERFSNILNDNVGKEEEVLNILGSSIINGALSSFMAFYNEKKVISYTDILNTYPNIKDKVLTLSKDEIYALQNEIINEAKSITPKQVKNLVPFLKEVLSDDNKVAFFVSLSNSKEGLNLINKIEKLDLEFVTQMEEIVKKSL